MPTVKPSIDAATVAPKTRPKPVFTGRPAVAQLEGKVVVFEGTFRHEENESFTTETRLTGDPRRDKQSLINLARAKYPAGRMELRSTRIITRELGAQARFPKGTSVGQVFGENGSLTENALEIGSVFWGGERCQIFLVNLRSRNAVNIALRQPGGARVSFSNQIAANTPAITLKHVVKEVLGQEARELSISLKIDQ